MRPNYTDMVFGDAVYINTAKLTSAPIERRMLSTTETASSTRLARAGQTRSLRPFYNTAARAVKVG